jgi:uncharacterized protein YdaU (DUF1376 family)
MSDLDDASEPRKRKPHQADPWYKRYPRDFHDDTRVLTLAERGAYGDILDLIYMAEGPIPDEEGYLAHKLHCHKLSWRPIRRRLLALGFLYITRGQLMNKRAGEVLKTRKDERIAMGSRGDSREVQPRLDVGLEKNIIDFNAHLRASSTESESDQERESKKEKKQPRRPIPKDILFRLEQREGKERADALVDEYHDNGMAAGAKHLRKAFVGWLAKEHGIRLGETWSPGESVGDLTAQALGNLCGFTADGKPDLTLPKVISRRTK